MTPLVSVHTLRQSGLPAEVAEGNDMVDRIHETVVGVVTAVYPVDHHRNDSGQMFADVQLSDKLPALLRVPLSVGYAHGETQIATANTRHRQPYDPKPRNQMDGVVYDVRPGTRVLVQFLGGDLRAPVITGIVKFNLQGEQAAPVERQGIDRFDDDGHFVMREVTPVDSSLQEYPRAVDSYNGTKIERDNRTNLTFQTSTDHAPVHPGHNGIPKAPNPQGNIVASTRGAPMGRQGRITGEHPITGDAGDGTIRDETAGAKIGNAIRKLASEVGRIWESTRGSGDGRVYLEDKERSYVGLRANGTAEIHGGTVVLDADQVCLGNDSPPYSAVLWEPLNDFIDLFTTVFDAHGHTDVKSGSDTSGPPAAAIKPLWTSLFLMGAKYQSDHVKLVKAEASTPHVESDPDGEG